MGAFGREAATRLRHPPCAPYLGACTFQPQSDVTRSPPSSGCSSSSRCSRITLWTAIALNFTYSAGERAGFLQKISKRGWVCKTWEGELQMIALPGSTPEKFLFTVRSDSVAAVLNGLAGQRVTLNYKQHMGVPGSCFGDTEYFVVGVKPLGPP